MTFLMICNIAIYAYTTLYSRCDRASDLWQKLELAFELESDLRGTVDWGRTWLVDFGEKDDGIVFLLSIGLGFLHYLYY